MDQSYFQNEPNLVRILHEAGKSNLISKTAGKFGISVTGIMGVNCESLMECYTRNNAFTTILTLVSYRILNMENEDGREILKNIITDPNLIETI